MLYEGLFVVGLYFEQRDESNYGSPSQYETV